MTNIQYLKKLRPLGKLEQVSATSHHLGLFYNVGVSANYELSASSSSLAHGGFDLQKIVLVALRTVISKHQILAVTLVNEGSPEAYFAALPTIDLSKVVTFVGRSQPLGRDGTKQDVELDAILEFQHNTCLPTAADDQPCWKLIVVANPPEETEFTAFFIFHHAIGDGISGLIFHQDFHRALEDASLFQVSDLDEDTLMMLPSTTTTIPKSLEELHPLPPSPDVPTDTDTKLTEWTGELFKTPLRSRWVSLCAPPDSSKAFFEKCKQKDLSVTSVLSSIIAEILLGLVPPSTEALSCIIPVNLRPFLNLSREVADSTIGTYIDATTVQLQRSDLEPDIGWSKDWLAAEKVSKAITQYVGNISPSGEHYTKVAAFKDIPDLAPVLKSFIGQPRAAAFELTNIGRFSLALEPGVGGETIWKVGRVTLSRSPTVMGAAITVTVVTGADGFLILGFSWQAGVVEDEVVFELKKGLAYTLSNTFEYGQFEIHSEHSNVPTLSKNL